MIQPKMTPPEGLQAPGKDFWNNVVSEYEIESPSSKEILTRCCHLIDRLDQIRKELAKGIHATNRYGESVPSKWLTEERSTIGLLRLALRELGLDAEIVEAPRMNRGPYYKFAKS